MAFCAYLFQRVAPGGEVGNVLLRRRARFGEGHAPDRADCDAHVTTVPTGATFRRFLRGVTEEGPESLARADDDYESPALTD